MKILYIAVHQHLNWGAEYFVNNTLKKTGCETICLDFRKHRHILNERITGLVRRYDPDIILLQRGDNLPGDLFDGLDKPVIFWASELVSRTADQNACIRSPDIDFVFFHSVECFKTILETGWRSTGNSGILINGFSSDIIDSIPYRDRDIDILFVGHINSRRLDILDALAAYFPIKVVSGVYGIDYFRLLKRAKIVLNIHFTDRLDLETRIFEALGCGTCILTEKLSEDAAWVGLDRNCLVEADGLKEVPDKIQHLLNHPEILETYWHRAKQESFNHTWEKRVQDNLIKRFSILKENSDKQKHTTEQSPLSVSEKSHINHAGPTTHQQITFYIPRWFFPTNLGDSLLATALVHPIRDRFSDKELEIVCDEFLLEAFNTNPLISRVRLPNHEEIHDVNYWKQLMYTKRGFFSIWPEWHSNFFQFLRQGESLQEMIASPDKNLIVSSYLYQNGFHPVDTKRTLPHIYLTADDKEWARQFLAPYRNRYNVCLVVSEKRRAEMKNGYPPLRYSEESWRKLVRRLKNHLKDVTVFEIGNLKNYRIGDHFIPPIENIRRLAAVLNEMDIGVMSDGGIHHVFNAIDKPYVLFQAYECNPPDLYVMQTNGAFSSELHTQCRFQCHLFSKILNIEDESKRCNHSCYNLDPYALAEFTGRRLLGEG